MVMIDAKETYAMEDFDEGTIFEPFGRDHTETHEASLSDIGIRVGAERRTVSEHRLTRWGGEARADRLDWRQG